MAGLRLVGVVGIKVRPDTSGFRKDTQDEIDNQLGKRGEKVDAKAKVEVDADTTKAKVKVTKLADEIKNKGVKLNVGVDYDGVRKAKEQIDQALKSLDNKVLSFEMNKDSIAAAKRELAKIEKNAKVEMKIIRDEAGFQSVLKKIQQIRNEKGLTKVVKFATDKESLKKAEKEALEGLKRLEAQRTVTIGYTKNYDGLLGAIGQIDKMLADVRKLKIETKLDEDSLEATKAKLLNQLRTAPVTVKFNEDKEGYEKVLSRIKEIQKQKLEKEITFKTDDESLEEQTNLIKEKIRKLTNLGSDDDTKFRVGIHESSLAEAKHKAEELKSHIDSMKAAMQIGLAGNVAAHAELAFLGRDRVVNFIARVNKTSIAAAEGALKGIGGFNILSGFGNNVANLVQNFDTIALKASALAVALGALANAGIYAGAALVRIGEGVGQSLGLLAAAPAILGAATIGYTVFTAAFNNFFDAFNKDPIIAKASLEALPPLARKTVDSITGLYKGLANPIQERFWEKVGTTLSDAITHLYPNLKTGLMQSTDAVGEFVAGFGRSMTKLSLTGDFDKIFSNTAGFFEKLSGASEPFFDGWNKFGVKGSELLPRFGQWITDAAVRFDEWATKASANGKIIDWIEHGVNSFQNMWSVGGSVADMFGALNRAAATAGMGGLAQFTINMRKAADEMQSEPWQSRAANIFEGARKGAGELNTGFENLTSTLGKSSEWLGTVLTQLGSIGGESLTRLSDLLGRKTYQDGITAELAGLDTLVSNLGPAFMGLGDVIGNMGKISGSVLGSMAPVLNQIIGLLDDSLSTIADNLVKVAPKAVATIGGVLGAVTPLVTTLVAGLDSLLDLIALVPNSFVLAGVAAGAFFAMRGLASKFFETFQQSGTFKNLESHWLTQQVAAGNTVEKYRLVNGEMQKFTVPTERFNATSALWNNMSSSVGGVREQIRTLQDDYRTMATSVQGHGLTASRVNPFAGLQASLNGIATITAPAARTALSGLFSALGGPWGIAIGAAAIGIGMFAQGQAEAKADTDALTQSIDKQTGVMNKQGLEQIAKRWTDVGKAQDWAANLARGSTKAANETVQALGQNISEMTIELSKGGDAANGLAGKWSTLGDSMKVLEGAMQSRRPLDQVRGDADKAAAALGLTVEKIQASGIHADDILHVAKNLEEEARKADVARLVFEGLGEATGQTTVEAQLMAGAMRTIGDDAIGASGKIGAIKTALDLLKGGTLSARDAQVAAEQASQNAVSQAAAIRDELAKNNHLIDQNTKLIDITSTSGLKLQQTMETSADAILVNARAAYEAAVKAGDTPAMAMTKAQAIVDAGDAELQRIADAAGVSVDILKTEWEGFFGADWQLTATFTGAPDQFLAAKKTVEEAGLAWNESVYKALLTANPDPATWTVDQTKAWAKDYANAEYKAQLTAINPDALAQILVATGQAENYKNGNYTAVMKALNSTDPGVQGAWANLMGVVGGPAGAGWAAALKAYADAIALANTRAALDNLAATRTARIAAQIDYGDMPALDPRTGLPKNADGSLSTGPGRYFPGLAPTQFFADGGFSGLQFEKPGPAKIYAPTNTWRVFSEMSTGGEAFIPMAASKRGRSTQILAQVAQQFGYKLSKAQQFEDGGIIASTGRTGGGVTLTIGNYNTSSNDTPDDVARALMRRVKTAGVYTPLEGF